jgi:hypothetical protein
MSLRRNSHSFSKSSHRKCLLQEQFRSQERLQKFHSYNNMRHNSERTPKWGQYPLTP